eukprot:Protomagalhaensia_wolfi_Nauph_80__2733@NODE_285_length_2930_cov_186_191283_g213_i0_p1_GENE_NODE_285_length_2930_cov_186_191283_g213_i0NODE_285_length_2930_cov_186_191283_g213_i0_p1_ORF_typecomplete_len187_score28_01_NODE_285_length_2930_cov_186_191283_g213_i04941054
MVVKADLQDFVEGSQPQMNLSFVPNRESLSRNDSRLAQQSGNKRNRNRRSARVHSPSVTEYGAATTSSSMPGGHPVFHLYSQKGKSVLGEAQRAAFLSQSTASLVHAVPTKGKEDSSKEESLSCGSEEFGHPACDSHAAGYGYWLPNCGPPDTFCLTPYAASCHPYAYTRKGTTYYPVTKPAVLLP